MTEMTAKQAMQHELPWLASAKGIPMAAMDVLRREGMVEAVFPEARPGDSGRQFFRWTEKAGR